MQEALEKSNYHEQFSRTNNIKILGIKDLENENETKLTERVISLFKDKAKVEVEPSEIISIHRIPS